jgi:serine/threonine protein kinase/tetratricopeptide (TPR) repeat protein
MPMIALGPYDLHRRLMSGGMGEVWVGVHRGERLPVAVKVLTAGRAREERYRTRFKSEVRAVAGLDHPHIVVVHDHGELDRAAEEASEGALVAGSPYLVMEYVAGGSLSTWVASEQPPEPWLVLKDLLFDLLDALAHAHARGILHRDLKPSNVLVAWDGERAVPKLTDFGLARALDTEGAQGDDVVGTPAFMAPEVWHGQWRDYGAWTDLYGFGCLVFELVTGYPAFRGKTARRMALQHLGGHREPLRPRIPVPPDLEAWLGTLLARQPARRFACAADASNALRALAEPPPDRAASSPSGTPAAEPARPLAVTLTVSQILTPVPGQLPEEPSEDPTLPSAPPVPPTWRPGARVERSTRALRGLGLFGLRQVPMVDRSAERDLLWAALERACREKRPALVVLRGPSGVGKSRLAEWLCERAYEVGVAFSMKAVVSQDAEHVPEAMLAQRLMLGSIDRLRAEQRLERLLSRSGETDPREWQALATLLAEGTEQEVAEVHFASRGEEHAVLRAQVLRMARVRPQVVWVEDAHHSHDTLSFLEGLLDAGKDGADLPLLVLLTVREDALAERSAEAEAVARLLARPEAQALDVRPLAEEYRHVLVNELLGLEPELATQVEERTAGNPLFAVQLVGDWVERGILVPGEHGYRSRPGATLTLPADLVSVWAMRVERALEGRPPEEGYALELAAILGHEVAWQEWRTACAIAGFGPAWGALDALAAQRLVGFSPDGQSWSFSHGMLREWLLARAEAGGRASFLHGAAAELLASRSGAGVSARLGRQLLAAGKLEEALEPLLMGADDLWQAGDLRGADALARERARALEALACPEADERWGETFVLASRIAMAQAQLVDAEAWIRRAEQGAETHGWHRIHAAVLREHGRLLRGKGELGAAYKLLKKAHQAASAHADPRLATSCLAEMSYVLVDRGALDRAAVCLSQALAGAMDDIDRGACALGLATIAVQQGEIARALELVEEAQRCYDRGGYRWGRARCQGALGEIARMQGGLAAEGPQVTGVK